MSGIIELIRGLSVWYLSILLTRNFRSIVNEAAAASPVQPIVNMGQGFLYVCARVHWEFL